MAKARKQAALKRKPQVKRSRETQGARSGHAGSDPQRAARGRQRDGGRPAAHLLQHDDLRGARLLHRADRPRRQARLAERRRRVALRRRPRRHHRRRHAALRPQGLQAGRRHHHQPPGGRRPAPQQRGHLRALFLQGRAADVHDGARALDRHRRHVDRLRRRPDRGRSLARRAAARSAQDLRRRQAQRDALPRAQGQHPLPGILARRHEIADGGLPARREAHGRDVRQIRPRDHPRRDRDDLRRDRAEVPQRRRAASRRRLRSGVRDRRRRRAQGRAGADPRQGHDQERRDDHRPVRLLGRAQVGRQLAHARRRPRRLQGADRPERSGQRRLVPRAQRHHPGRQRDDGALSGADVVVEHHDPDGGRHHRQGAGRSR